METYSSARIIRMIRDGEITPDQLDRTGRYLNGTGWFASMMTRRPQDWQGKPLPWYVYSATELLQRRMIPGLSVFEFGSGMSTLWWAERAEHVTSVEHHFEWYVEVEGQLPDHVDYYHVDLVEDGEYCRAAVATGRKYDVIVNDGKDRGNCALHTLPALTERGVIVWDNAQRTHDQPFQDAYLEQGFRRVDFWGNGPINIARWMTSIFYRDGNWMKL